MSTLTTRAQHDDPEAMATSKFAAGQLVVAVATAIHRVTTAFAEATSIA
jgi:hypothetical protein